MVVAQTSATRAGSGLDNARRYTHEHGIALELQRALLSEPGSPHPSVEGGVPLPAAGGSALVGATGTTPYAAVGRTLLAMGDVMGHGVEPRST